MKKIFVFWKIYFKVKVLKTLKMFNDYHKKRRWSTVFGRACALSVNFRMKPLRKDVFLCWDKPKLNFADKLTERGNGSFFCLFDESELSNTCTLSYVTMECRDITRLSDDTENVRKSQTSILITELSKTQFFPHILMALLNNYRINHTIDCNQHCTGWFSSIFKKSTFSKGSALN